MNQKSEYIHVIHIFVSSWYLSSFLLSRTHSEKTNSEPVGNRSDSCFQKSVLINSDIPTTAVCHASSHSEIKIMNYCMKRSVANL